MTELTKDEVESMLRTTLNETQPVSHKEIIALCRDWLAMDTEIERLKQGRCLVTGNPCGTDTRAMGDPCPCFACADYTADVEVQGIVAMYESDIANLQAEIERPNLSEHDPAGRLQHRLEELEKDTA